MPATRTSFALTAALLALVACNRTPEPAATPAPTTVPQTAADRAPEERTQRGAVVYAANCAVCHGVRAEGAKDWHRVGPDGKYPPPPLDGSAHAWHHPRAQLKQIILDGTQPRGGMPAWRGKLSDEDIEAVIDWFQSLWPPEIFRAWQKLDQQAR